MLNSRLPPKKPPRMNIIKAANKFDAAQLKMSSTIASCMNTNSSINNINTNANINTNNNNDNDIEIIKTKSTITTRKPMPLAGQLSADKVVMTKKKHLHFHSPLIKGPLKNPTEAIQVAIEEQQQQQQQQKHNRKKLQNNEQELPRLLFDGIESDKAARINLALTMTTTTSTTTTTTCTKLTKGTIATSNIAKIIHHDNEHKHDDHHTHEHDIKHHYDNKDHGVVSKVMNFKVIENKIARKRLDRGCTSLMYACQHGDISEVLDQLHNKV